MVSTLVGFNFEIGIYIISFILDFYSSDNTRVSKERTKNEPETITEGSLYTRHER